MHILFAYPFFLKDSKLEQEWQTPYFPLGILYLAAAVRDAGHQVSIFDGTFVQNPDEYIQLLDKAQPDVVCISSLITLRPRALDFATHAQSRNIPVIIGGPDAGVVPEIYAAAGAYVVTGSGEQTLIELLYAIEQRTPVEAVAGLVYQHGSGMKTTAIRKISSDVTILPLPARDLIDYAPYYRLWQEKHGYTSLTLAATRACTCDEDCDGCIMSTFGMRIRARTPEDVAVEMKLLEATHPVDRFRLVDDLEALGEAWLCKLGNAMMASGVTTPYEGLKPLHFNNLPMYAPQKDLCAERTVWLPGIDRDATALDFETIQRRWTEGSLQDGEEIASSCQSCS